MMQKISFQAMGCQMMAALDSPAASTRPHLENVPVWFEAWEQTLSRFRADSELAQLNRAAGRPQLVSPVLGEVLQLSLEMVQKSMGLVSPLVLDALAAAGYDRSFERLSPFGNGSLSLAEFPIPGTEAIDWEPESRLVQLPVNFHLDFGGVAKGWAAHRAMQKLQAAGPVLVDAAGDIAISGLRADGSPWPVAIADPHNPGEELALLKLGRSGVATSGIDRRRWQAGDRWHHHIIDPRTGLSAETDVLSVTVIAPTVMAAEMAAKVTLILGSEIGLKWLEIRPDVAALLVLNDAEMLITENFEQYLWE